MSERVFNSFDSSPESYTGVFRFRIIESLTFEGLLVGGFDSFLRRGSDWSGVCGRYGNASLKSLLLNSLAFQRQIPGEETCMEDVYS